MHGLQVSSRCNGNIYILVRYIAVKYIVAGKVYMRQSKDKTTRTRSLRTLVVLGRVKHMKAKEKIVSNQVEVNNQWKANL